MKLTDLLSRLHYGNINVSEDPEIESIEMDSRKAGKGSLFICIKGYTVDGHHFAEQAVDQGAAAVIAERELDLPVPVIIVPDTSRAMAVFADAFYGQPTQKLHLIGVTGTNGKTTTSHLIDMVLQSAGKKTGMIGTMYIKIGDETLEVRNTTPESLTLQKTFKKMGDSGVTHAVMEVSSHALHMGRVHGCDYDVAVFTNLTQDHLDYHGTMDAYKQAKGLLFSQLGNTFNHHRPKYAVLNQDDPAAQDYKSMTAAHILTYGIDQQADIMASNIVMTASGTEFLLQTPFGSRKMKLKLIGKFSVYNVLAAIAASLATGIELETAAEALEKAAGVRGRFELVDAGQPFAVIVDYAHTPDSLENVLTTTQSFSSGRTFVVVGCGGDRDKTKRPIMAQIAVKYAEEPIFTSDNPRSEDAMDILADMEEGVQGAYYHSIANREQAIYFAIANARPGDVVLIAGKGHETYQQIGDHVYDFDDREVALKAISSLKIGKSAALADKED
ncbi:UDP-N-acetylmuramoyl-L-alanyl-D-glutamate--2,6-diaminopimelate ligase [Bacillus sp. FJAT-42376]|uniref:UDP-N-acetylmuramoyl-L-alanyl-D-glutamate--2, 6-diaminopimelate ligase n=1 Tax=Bacillus sp. FJAT-42376 TaxID=2014076 RepID=UPI000F4E8F24|nr:UDP-N-acetylmuramoyl-L-alanyl-D-glutamate--2,6-diaminopimelate ligase [Bacillus sp. FJAT-42376]AZB42836.1 UDP-N-acetylmuramoyl-L-alanyl-D-glutamate--2,6-diaminopimelate ligase [Bacillus sp. FJAT-42376]